MMSALKATVTSITVIRRSGVAICQLIMASVPRIAPAEAAPADAPPSESSRSAKFAVAVGTTVIATSIDTRIVAETPIAMSP